MGCLASKGTKKKKRSVLYVLLALYFKSFPQILPLLCLIVGFCFQIIKWFTDCLCRDYFIDLLAASQNLTTVFHGNAGCFCKKKKKKNLHYEDLVHKSRLTHVVYMKTCTCIGV